MTPTKPALQDLSLLQKKIDEAISSLELPSSPRSLYEPFSYMLKLGGKRLRPLMVLLACQSFGSEARKAMPQAIAVELFHNFTLIHDDMMDHATLRRGFATVHEKFGETAAILSGDVMLVYAYEYLIRCESQLVTMLSRKFNDCAISVCEGQQLDMDFEKRQHISPAEYLHMITCKTATLIATALEMGAFIGGASEQEAKHFYDFGKNLGIAFQMQDDWLDSFGDSNKFGKKKGGDILQRKKTFLLLTAREMGNSEEKMILERLYAEENISENQVKQIVGIFESSGAGERTKEKMTGYYELALQHLQLSASSENSMLENLAASLFYRDH